MALPNLFAKRFLGIDIGTSAVRIVELEDDKIPKLTNYGELKTEVLRKDISMIGKKAMAFFSVPETSAMIKTIIDAAKIKTRQCVFAIPDFSTFFTNFKLPPMAESEIKEAVMFEARQHIPLPLESVAIDWQLISGAAGNGQNIEILLAAIPNEIVEQYKAIAKNVNLEIISLEAEVFGLIEALIGDGDTRTICLVDIGVQSTICSVVEKRILMTSHSFDIGSNYLLDQILNNLLLDQETIRQIKKNYGLKFFSNSHQNSAIYSAFEKSLESIVKEVELTLKEYKQTSGKEISKIIISGGAALSPVIEQFKKHFMCEVEPANPFAKLHYPTALIPDLQKIAPVYSVAVGMALRGINDSKKQKTAKHHPKN